MTQHPPRVVLVETSDALPGLLPFQAWDALATAEVVYCRDVESHPSAQHLWFAGVDLATLEPAKLEMSEMNLMQPGDPTERRLAKALLTNAAEHRTVVYLLGPDDERLPAVVGSASGDHEAEVEFVFLAQEPQGSQMLRLVQVMKRLRDPDGGCPWDLEQDHASLKKYAVEEVYELIDAIDGGDDADIVEELGDVLLQVVFHAQVGADRRAFTIDDVARGIVDKLVQRHPHVFGGEDAATAEEVQANWDQLKAEEKGRTSPFDGVPRSLPGLMLATTLQRKAANLGFDWRDATEPEDRAHQELAELEAAGSHDERVEELGDLLGAVVGMARHLGIDPEEAMRQAADKFRARFEAVLARAEEQDVDVADLDRDAWLALWDEVKQAE